MISTHQRTTQNKVTTAENHQCLLIQQKCSCGSNSKLSGQCTTCQKNKFLGVQTKLRVGAAYDVYEQEADHVADQVMAKSKLKSNDLNGYLKAAPLVQRQVSNIHRDANEVPSVVHDVLRSPSQPIDQVTRDFMEPRFGYDFSAVRVHTGEKAAKSALAVNSLAYTVGRHVVFGAGKYSSGTTTDERHLLAHELTHVAQQGANDRHTLQRLALAIDYEKLAREIEDAVSGLGTDEEAIYRALTKLQRDPDSVNELEAAYSRLFSETLMQALEGDLDQEELDYAKGLMGKPATAGSKQRIETSAPTSLTQWDALARRIKAAVEYQTLGFLGGTDEEAIFAVLQPLANDANKIESIKLAYARITSGPSTALVDAIKDEMSSSELSHALELLAVEDPHAGTQTELSRAQVLAIRNELQPGTAVPPPPPGGPLPAPAPWDGRAGAPGAAANRAALRTDLLNDLTNHLTREMPDITAAAADPKLPIAALQGAANAAVEVTDDEYESWYEVVATTPSQTALRSGFQFSQAAGNLLDATDPAARASVGIPLSARSVATWMVKNDDPPVPPGGVEHMAAHNFNPIEFPPNAEETWLQTNVITPFISPLARNADLRLYDQFGFALQPQPGKIVLPTTVAGSSLAGGGPPNMADRSFLWSTWHIAVHEYLHNLEHPTFEKSLSANEEGFTEYFTKGVTTKIAPVAHQNSGLVHKVEGGIFAPPTTPALVGPYTTVPAYVAALAHVENVVKTVPGGDRAIRAAYFQGHTEMLGIDPTTRAFATAPSVAVDSTLVNVPTGIANLNDLATRSGVPKSEILAANLGLTAAGPLPPKLKLPGAREHMVVTTFQPAGAVGPSETVEQIAAQNGVSVEALKRANPGTLWGTLAGGQLILIPRH